MNAVRSIVAGVLCLATGMAQAVPLYQCPLTVNGYAEGKEALADFPVLVRISTAIEQFAYGDCAAGGADISFTSEDGVTVHPHEVDTWNPDGESLVWVKLPSMAHGTKFLFRWADPNPLVNDTTAVWPGYVGVWHFNSYGENGTPDSTSHGFTATNLSSWAWSSDTNPKNGSGALVGLFQAPDYEPTCNVGGTFSVSGWVYGPTYPTEGQWIGFASKNVGTGGDKRSGFLIEVEGKATSIIWVAGDNQKSGSTMPNCKDVTKNWQYFTMACNGSKAICYLDGAKVGEISKTIGGCSSPFTMGGKNFRVDEYRVRQATSSADWVKAEYEVATKADYLAAGTTEIQSLGAVVVSSDGPRYGVVSPAYGQITEPEAGTTYDFSCTVATQTLNEAKTTRAVCTGWELRKLSNGELIKASSFEGESQFSCSHTYVQGEGVELKWRWQIQHLVTATAGTGGSVSPTEQWVDAGETCAPIAATADDGYGFYMWTGDVPAGGAAENPLACPVNAPLAVTANFSKCIYVTLGGSDEGAGTEAAPYASIEKAVASAGVGDVIVVGEGKFPLADTLYLNRAIVIRGAGSGKTTLQHKTTQDSRAVVLECADAAIEDCTITGGYLNAERGKNTDAYAAYIGGAGVLIKAAGGRLSRCRITANKSNGNWNTSGGIACVSSKAVVEHCTIDNNTTGGTAGTYAGVYVTAGTFDHCLIYANSGHSAGGVYVAGAATFSYCTIARNSGFGICLAESGAKFLNCVIAGNLSSSMADGAPEYTGSFSADFTGTAFPKDVVLKPAVITGEPLSCAVIFNDAANYDFTQRLASQAKDCGCYVPYDYSVFSCDCTVSVEGLFVGEPVTLIPYVTGYDEGDVLAYAWTVTCPDGTKKPLTEESPAFKPEQKGWHDVSLSVSRGKGEPATFVLPHAFVATPRELTVTTGSELMAELGDAIDGQTIYLAASDKPYEITKALDISKDVKVIGPGWDRCTIKQKTNGQRVINLNNKDALVEGVTVTGGKNNSEGLHGVGVNIAGYGGTLRNCRVIGNTVTLNHTYGIGVALQSADALVDHCIISNNTRTGGSNGNYGGGIYASAGTVTDCLVVNNGSAQHGGGIYAAGGVTVRNCTFAKNSAYANGGGVYLGSTSAKFYNCIFAENTSSASDTTTGKPEWSGGSAATMDRCSFPTAVATNSVTGGKCLLVDPVFVGSDAGDFHILSSSPTKDAGTDAHGLSEFDLDGFTRVSGKGVDIGCYEFDSDQFSASFSGPATGDGLIHSNAVFTAEVSGLEEGTEVAYAWTVTSPSGKVTYPTGNPLTLAPDEFGNWHISMVATAGGLTSEPFESDYYAAPEVIYVKPATAETIAAAEWPYGDPDHAATNVLDAVDAARDGTRIELDEGEFTVNKRINVTKRIDLVGKGWEKTIIRQKAKTVSVLYVNSEKAKVRQVTLTGMFSQGEINSRGAVMIETQGGTIEDCRITGNRYDPSLGINHARGVGITLAGAKAICRRCIIDRNYGSLGGNGDRGGGVQGLAGLLENCLVCCNTNSGAGGIYIECGGDKNKPGFTVRNCTVCGNVANGADSTGLYGNYGTGGLVASGFAYIANTIFFANESPVQTWTNGGYPEWRDLGASVKIVNCLMGEDIPLPSMAVGSITNNPCFVDAASDDYHLQKGSPCVNGGVNDGAYTAESLDLDRNLRVFNFGRKSGKPDLGCYETPWGTPGMMLWVR